MRISAARLEAQEGGLEGVKIVPSATKNRGVVVSLTVPFYSTHDTEKKIKDRNPRPTCQLLVLYRFFLWSRFVTSGGSPILL